MAREVRDFSPSAIEELPGEVVDTAVATEDDGVFTDVAACVATSVSVPSGIIVASSDTAIANHENDGVSAL